MKNKTKLYRIAFTISTRTKGLFKELKRKYENVPEYVFREIYNGDTDKLASYKQFEQILRAYNEMTWKLEPIELHWDKLNGITKNNFRRRKFGIENPDGVPNDTERLARQIKSQAADGKNEPMVFINTSGGLELVEGFHRTMALLLHGSKNIEETINDMSKASGKQIDEIANSWEPTRARAWVGYEQQNDEEIDFGEGDFF
jgi:hypothetical protein